MDWKYKAGAEYPILHARCDGEKWSCVMLTEGLFRESLIESSAATVAQRSCATLMSFGLEMAAIAILLVVPLFVTQTIPLLTSGQFITAPLAAPHHAPKPTTEIFTAGGGGGSSSALVEPTRIPAFIAKGPGPKPPGGNAEVADCTGCVEGGVPWGGPGGNSFLRDVIGKPAVVIAHALPPAPNVVHISHIDPGMLISTVEPKYPPLARATRVQGEVLLAAIIGKDGRIENLKVLRSHPLLVGAALDAVRQWRYRPTILNGQPVEIDTTISVVFTLRQE